MRASLLEMMSFAIVALALVGPRLILWLMVSERSAQAQDRPALNTPRPGSGRRAAARPGFAVRASRDVTARAGS